MSPMCLYRVVFRLVDDCRGAKNRGGWGRMCREELAACAHIVHSVDPFIVEGQNGAPSVAGAKVPARCSIRMCSSRNAR